MSAALSELTPGFSSPVSDSQETFRILMNCFSYPAMVRPTPMRVAPIGSLNAVAAGLVLCLADSDTPIWLDAELRGDDAVKSFIGFHCGAPIVEDTAAAKFAFAASPQGLEPLGRFAQGTMEYPDRSTTIILQVRSFTEESMSFAGPGIPSTRVLGFIPELPDFTNQWAANHEQFPLGVDLILASASHMAALPRSVALMEA